jgi:hypothetical protein
MNEIMITSLEDLVDRFNEYPNSMMFRGQAKATYGLSSSLERLLNAKWSPEQAIRFEDRSLSQFRSKYLLYDTSRHVPQSKLAWLGAMQHFGVPTRLIDFTTSPYVALYFAIESYPFDTNPDFAVFAIDYTKLMDASIGVIASQRPNFNETRKSINSKQDEVFEQVVDVGTYDIAWIAEPRELNVRMDRQEGTFLLSGNRAKRIAEILDQSVYKDVPMDKLIISGDLHGKTFGLLRKANVTSKSIYGDLSGLAQAIRMELRAYA